MNLTGKVVLITGAKGGLGATVTQAFLEAGARVVGVSRSIVDTDFPHENFLAAPADLSLADQVDSLVASVVAQRGRLDAAIHLAGGFAGGKSVAETDDATVRGMLEMNYISTFHLVRAVIPAMRTQGSGRIVAIGSRSAVEPQARLGAYSASKAALVSLIRTVARENNDHGITANVVLPVTMDTPANRAAMPGADLSKWIQTSQVASLLVYLASDQGYAINGAVIPVYGAEA
ncbi:MAG TPA: SDR family NAD(P)-dependent oxidoreductase [Bryobacteraceae bacterium]|jgi:NAD(P)-dependent dehydrogenase (short-subunit alcohol dehydrogenase family)